MKKKDSGAIPKEARKLYERCQSNESDNRKEAKEDIEFARLSKQWPEAIRKQREAEGRPCLTVNKLAPVVRQVVNDARQNRPSIKVLPQDSKSDKDTAEVMSGLIRNIEQASNADIAYDTAVDCAVSSGWGYWRVNLEYTFAGDADDLSSLGLELFEQDITIERIANQFSVYGDPDGVEADSSDWMKSIIIEDMTHSKFEAKYPNAVKTDFESSEWSDTGDWKTEDKVRVAEYWKREETTRLVIGVNDPSNDEIIVMPIEQWQENQDEIIANGGEAVTEPRPMKSYKVTQYLVTGVELLETNEWPGVYIPIVPVYGDEVNLEGTRHYRSLIRDAKDSNRMFNFWRSASTELVALAPKAPFIGPKGSFETDAQKWATANSQSHAYIEYDEKGAAPQRQPFAGIPAGALQEAANSSDDVKAITGIYDASLGARSNETSGVAINARKREGDVSTFHFIDNLTRSIRHTGKIIVDLIPKVYSTERIVRILGEDGTPETVGINGEQPEGNQDDIEGNMQIYDLRVGRYDISVTAGPSFTTRREESAEQMFELLKAYPDAAPIIGDLFAKNLDWPGADEIAKRLEKMLPAEVRDGEGEVDPETQQQIQQMSEALEAMQAELGDKQADRDLDEQKLSIERYKAETERMTAMQPAMGPEQIQAVVMQVLGDLATPNDLPQEAMPGPTGSPESAVALG